MSDSVPRFAGHVLTAVILVWGIRQMIRTPAAKVLGEGKTILKYNVFISYLGGVLILFFCFLAIWTIRSGQSTEAAVIVFGVFVLMGIGTILIGLRNFVEFDESKITSYAFWRGPKTLHWAEIVSVSFVTGASFRLESIGGETIRVNMMLGGINFLLAAFSRKLQRSIYEKALAEHQKMLQRYEKDLGPLFRVPQSKFSNISVNLNSQDLENLLLDIAKDSDEGFTRNQVMKSMEELKALDEEEGEADLEFEFFYKGHPVDLQIGVFKDEETEWFVEFSTYSPLSGELKVKVDRLSKAHSGELGEKSL